MARVTVEDCLARVPNRFALTILAARRARALSEGRGHRLVECDNKEGVAALREVSDGKVRFREEVEGTLGEFIEEQRRQLRVTTGETTFLEAASLRALEDDEVEDDEEAGEIEELQADPEALNKQAAGEDEEGEAESTDEEEEADFDEGTGFADDDLPDDAAEVEPPELGEDDESAEEEEDEEESSSESED
jgi:DNA-directed RNA polymerase subunit omega